ncbi:hypothetical protein ACMD2_01270 [Ananas comosus]|uniref:Rhodanese domain-containing protein n=1 Tax=Ananas comosus TaxID=4615 RepID=A0A199VA18_ANACO|nr:hypothetical protein ACMD2_01270 [Ananas comosus]
MLPVSSAALNCSSSLSPGTKAFYSLRKTVEDRSTIEERHFLCMQDGTHMNDLSFRAHSSKSMQSIITDIPNKSGSSDSSIFSPYPNDFDDIVRVFPKEYFNGEPDISCNSAREVTNLDRPSMALPGGDDLVNIPDFPDQSASAALESAASDSLLTTNVGESTLSESSIPISDTVEGTTKGIVNVKESVGSSVSQIFESVDTSINRAQDALKSTYDSLTSSVSDAVKSVTKSVDNVASDLFSSVDISKKQAGGQLAGLSSALKENVYGAGAVAVDVLRRAIISFEESLGKAATFVVYSYGAAKSSLPPNVRDALNLSEDKASQILSPVGDSFQQVYVIIEGFEKNLGLDPNDPIVQFALLLGSSATIGTFYWVLIYGGYSGDLAPEETFELLKNDQNAVLVDKLRERDGVPDLRRGARSKYASVTLPEIDGSLKKMLKSGRDVENALIAVEDSKVIIMDANGTQSKAIARSLKRLGRPYLVKGGFESWAKKSLRIKELQPETALTVLSEEAEAILEVIKPTPTLVIGYALGISAAIYALLEWEKTLQVIGLVGLGQTLYRRVASYEDSEDLKQDVRLLLTPVTLGAQAFSWVVRKLEPNNIGLPTSPSTTAVQDRVLQAAAKHESQPSDDDGNQASGPATENLVSKA